VIVGFIDICGIIDQHRLNFLCIMQEINSLLWIKYWQLF